MTESEVPLHQLEVYGEPKVKSGKGAFTGLFLDKTKLIILAVVILVLLIIIIVLAAVLGHEQAKNRRDTPDKTPDKKEEVSPTQSTGPTTPGTEPWWQIRLPVYIRPKHYDLILYIDLSKPNFTGKVDILTNVSKSTPYILLHSRNLNFTTVKVQKKSGDSIPIKRRFKFEKNQFLVIVLESSIDKGMYVITSEFSGEYAADLRGMYKASFKYKNGTYSHFSATQFQPLRARKVFPCFDEPAMKATFNVSLVHDPSLIALSNMPIYKSEIKKGRKHDHFEKTKKMSTYLAAFAVGDFKYKGTKTDKGVDIRMYARAEVLDQVDYSLNVSKQCMAFFKDFFGVDYPLPKSDGIGLPVFGPAGMENWGLIKYRETGVLVKEGETSSSSREGIARLVAHEVAHLWFGDLVTMEWWSDLWLNEGFATYAGTIGVDHIHPDWKMVDLFIARVVQDSLDLDGLASSHKIRIPVNDPLKIGDVFDAISYKKGGSILLMLHNFLGNAVFRDGLKRYLNEHIYGNADTDDLWDAMVKAAGKSTVKNMMDTFTKQMGYPVVTITKSNKPNTFLATQDRFLYYRDPKANYSSSPYGYKWTIPFSYFIGASRTSNPPSKTIFEIIKGNQIKISWDGSGWIKGNIGQTGFYRVNYDKGTWTEIGLQLNHNHKVFNATDRAGLIDDSFNLARANLLNHTEPLALSTYLSKEEDYVPLLAAMRKFSAIMKILPPTVPAYKYLQRFVRELTKSQYDSLGIKDQGTHLERLKRILLINSNCAAGLAACLGNMTQLFGDWMADPVKNPVPADLKAPVYHYGVLTGGEKEWDFAYSQFTSTNVVSDKRLLLHAMAGAQEPWLIERYLNYALDPTKIGRTHTYYVIYSISESNAMGTNIAWNFFQLNWEKITKMFGGPYKTLSGFVPLLSKRFSTEYQLKKLQDFIASVVKGGPLSWSVQQAIERVKINIQWRKTNEKDVEKWLRDYFNRPIQPTFGPPAK
ncbi:hypothetical protein ABFA07_002475 [Porites harrisoni]